MGVFLRTQLTDNNLIRGAARLMAAPLNQPYPSGEGALAQVIRMTEAESANDKQTITITGVPTGGGIKLRFLGDTTVEIKFNATNKQVQEALEELPVLGANVKVTGGPGPGTAWVVEFTESRASSVQLPIEIAENALTGGTTPKAAVAHTTLGKGIFDPVGKWVDLGATKTGVRITRNQTEDVFDIDQVYGDLDARPTNWEMSVVTALAQASLSKLSTAWELGEEGKRLGLEAVTTDTSPATGAEGHLGLGLPLSYEHRRLAILHQRPNGLIRAHLLRRTVKMPVESAVSFNKTGEQQTMAVTFRALVDFTTADPVKNIGEIIDQSIE